MTKSNRPYFNLIANEQGSGWALVFGDYVRDVVVQEGEDNADSNDLKKKDWKVVCGSNVDAIDLCHALNNKTALVA